MPKSMILLIHVEFMTTGFMQRKKYRRAVVETIDIQVRYRVEVVEGKEDRRGKLVQVEKLTGNGIDEGNNRYAVFILRCRILAPKSTRAV